MLKSTISRSLNRAYGRIQNLVNRSHYPKDNPSAIDHPDQRYGGKTYAQHGDDLVILNIFSRLGIAKPTYLDVGAHHPFVISNTALLYQRGCRGINIEANPNLIKEFFKHRPDDINLNVGVGATFGEATFYMFDEFSGRNSFVKESLNDLSVNSEIKIPIVPIDSVVEKYCNSRYPDLLSIDVEGLDKEVLSSIDYSDSPPKVICVEIMAGAMSSEDEIKSLLVREGYFPYCWAGANMMFILNKYKSVMY